MGLPQKGSLRIGSDADLAIIDLNAEWTVHETDLHSSAGFSIYDGRKLRGRVVHTLSRGGFALRNGQLQTDEVGVADT